MLMCRSLVNEVPASPSKTPLEASRSGSPSLKDLGYQVASLFSNQLDHRSMLRMSARLQRSYLEGLQNSTQCMLPSFNCALPTGRERGRYLACDVGGSTLRVALVELVENETTLAGALNILHISVSTISDAVRQLSAALFFDWMAARIADMLSGCPFQDGRQTTPLSLGLSWSFPVEQTSPRSGNVQSMGKGFNWAQSIEGQELGGLILAACASQGLNLNIGALTNDSCAALLSRAYVEQSTSMSLILGTGTNMAIHLPVSCLGASQVADRDRAWLARAEMVTVNTELSMFGKGILPKTRWDDILNRNHVLPDFQPLEYMTTGRYLGEILRLILADAVDTSGLFDGYLPELLKEPYSLDAEVLAMMEDDTSCTSTDLAITLQDTLDLDVPPTTAEMDFLRKVVRAISKRAAAFMAVAIHALWMVERKAIEAVEPSRTTIVCNGSVIEKYPGFRSQCQRYITAMIDCEAEVALHNSTVVLQMADQEAAILGAAIAVALEDGV